MMASVYSSVLKIEQSMNRIDHKFALEPGEFGVLANRYESIVLDTRDSQDFAAGFIPNSLNIGINGNFLPWACTLIPRNKQHVLLVSEAGQEKQAFEKMVEIGRNYTINCLLNGLSSWRKVGGELDSVSTITAKDLVEKMKAESLLLLDVRKPSEFKYEHVEGSVNFPLEYINELAAPIDYDKKYYVYCAGGYRSMIFISAMRSRGYRNMVDVTGGYWSIRETHLAPIVFTS